MNKKIFKTSLIIVVWAIAAFLMSALYYFLLKNGIIWDNTADHTWNSRKVIFGIVSLSSFILAIVKIASVWED